MKKLIKGTNGSFAAMSDQGEWLIHGQPNVLNQQEPDEYAYSINADFNQILHLPVSTPIYSGVNMEYNDDGISKDYETIEDLFSTAQRVISNVYQNLEPNELKHFRIYNMFSFEAISHVAKNIWTSSDWACFDTQGEQLEQDIYDCLNNQDYDAYPELLKK